MLFRKSDTPQNQRFSALNPFNTDQQIINMIAQDFNCAKNKDKNLLERIRQFADDGRFKEARKNNDELLAQIEQLKIERDNFKQVSFLI